MRLHNADQSSRLPPKFPLETRLWARVEQPAIGDPQQCWEFMGARTHQNYGTIYGNGKPRFTHRVSYELCYGPIPPGMFVLHKCDNPPCINPFHLFLGDADVNAKDCVQKGRSTKGERSGKANFTETQVRAIRELVSLGAPKRMIARALGVSSSAISHIALGRSWRHLNDTTTFTQSPM